MQYVSTRGNSPKVGFEATLLAGYAPDGGLYVPAKLPEIPWRKWRSLTYTEIVKELAKIFLNKEIPLDDLISKAYHSKFSCKDIVKLKELEENLHVLELFHGQTWAFKDYSLAFLGELMQHCLEKENRHRILLVATSGDTGSAAMEAVKGKDNIDIIVLLPDGRISEIQEKQMTVINSNNTHPFAVDADSDELDDVLRPILNDNAMTEQYSIGSINSINWIRILLQMAHWFYAYFQTIPQQSEEFLTVVVPTGACGNIAAGLFAWKMGLPIKIVACTNKNDATHKLIQTGTLARGGAVNVSLAPAMDIQVPYNVERMLHIISNGDSALVKNLVENYYQFGSLSLPEGLHKELRKVVNSHCADDSTIKKTIEECHNKFAYYICPHTATALSYAFARDQRPLVCISTASPQKFFDVYTKCDVPLPEKSNKLKTLLASSAKQPVVLSLEQKSEWCQIVKDKIVEIGTSSKATSQNKH